ncbi:unnamed protein product [Adineta ricciae]|uniref:Uncharacterized protein n=1 Tax=Adineta ricciae TaxID=249248 RepID=A0A815EFH4_ADIRI|nr:unnamed protein product [Adineta ricciae]CAF1656727.1 unnamed protein product [Adineta ricciae]
MQTPLLTLWNSWDGKDEMDCDISLNIFNCSSDTRICVTLYTLQFSCIPLNKINNGEVDCFGGTDEPRICRKKFYDAEKFYCMNSNPPDCHRDYYLCNNTTECPNGDDEQFCLQNKTISDDFLESNYSVFHSNVKKFLLSFFKRKRIANDKYFRITGFLEKNEIEEDDDGDAFIPFDKISSPLSNSHCHRGLDLPVWLNQLSNHTCLCP